MQSSIQKDKKTQTLNIKHESEVTSLFSTFSSDSRKLSRQRRRQSKLEKDQQHNDHLEASYIATSLDGNFVATFNSETYELVYYKTENLQNPILVKNQIRKDINSPTIPSNLWWSLTISNGIILNKSKSKNNDNNDSEIVDILIAVSCFESKEMMSSPLLSSLQTLSSSKSQLKVHKSSSPTPYFSPESVSDVNKLENGDFGIVIEPRTWVYSTTQDKRIITDIDTIGGVVRFLDNSVTQYTVHSDEDEDSNYKLELVLVNSLGICKSNIYPKSNYVIPKSIFNFYGDTYEKSVKEFLFPPATYLKIKNLFQGNPCTRHLESCIEKNYFFSEDFRAEKIDIYNLKTGDLELSLFKNATSSSLASPPSMTMIPNYLTGNESNFAISKYESMVAYCGSTSIITLYLMENGLEIITKHFPRISRILSLTFIDEDTKLFIVAQEDFCGDDYLEKSKIITSIIIWDIFNSNNSGNLCQKLDVTSDPNFLIYADDKNFFTSSSGKIYSINANGKAFSLLDHPDISDYHEIYKLDGSLISLKDCQDKLIVNNVEPWINYKKYHRISVFLNDDKTTQLIIGSTTVQIWQKKITKENHTVKRILKYIWSNPSHKEFVVESIVVGKNKFHLKLLEYSHFSSNNSNPIDIHIHYPKSVNTIKDACGTLEYLSNRKIECIGPKNNRKFEYLLYHAEKLVFRSFVKSPSLWRLNEVRYDIMANLIRSNSTSLIKKILFKDNDEILGDKNKQKALENNDQHLHIPRLYGWPKVKKLTDLEVAIECACTKGKNHRHTIIIEFLLEYYSNHALVNVGWMFTVSQAIPLLLSKKNLEMYLKGLFYKPCFGTKEVLIDQCFVDSHELRKSEREGIYPLSARPRLIQKLPTNPSLMKRISDFSFKRNYEIKNYMEDDNELGQLTSVFVVPLPDFLLYPNGIKDKKLKSNKLLLKLLRLIIWPRQYIISKEEDRSAFLRVIRHKRNELIYDNPSLEACIKYKYPSAKLFYARQLMLYIAFSLAIGLHLSVNTFSNNGFTIPDDATEYAKIYHNPIKSTSMFLIVIYFSYYLLAMEFIQFKQEKLRKYANFHNITDLLAVILPFAVSMANYAFTIFSYLKSMEFINQGNSNSNDLKKFLEVRFDLIRINKYIVIGDSFVVLILWLQSLLLLRVFSRPAYFIRLIIDIIKSIWPFLTFMVIVVLGFASIGIYPATTKYVVNSTSTFPNPYDDIIIQPDFDLKSVSDNSFVDFRKSAESVYFWPLGRWDQVDQWDFWPVELGIFEEASRSVKQKTLKIQADLLADHEILEKPYGNSKGNPRFIYYVGKVNELENWLMKTQKFHNNRFKPWAVKSGEDTSLRLYDFEYEEFIDDDDDFDNNNYNNKRDKNKDNGDIYEKNKKGIYEDDDKIFDVNDNDEPMRFIVKTYKIIDDSSSTSSNIEKSLSKLQNEMKNLDSNVTNRIDTIENNIKEILKLIKSQQA
ncbi:13412_t:CDS:10 [Entrophospora sp. SA101]|nr:13412_t:CDS:10 [Entrophospora sp. SA101]